MVYRLKRRALVGGIAALPFLRLTAKANALLPRKGDQTAELQSAFDAAAQGNGHVQLGAGTFETDLIKVRKNITVTGIPGATRLKSRLGSIVLVEGARHVVLQGIGFSTQGEQGNLLAASDVEILIVEDCNFFGGESGARLTGCGGRISGSRFHFQREVAIQSVNATGLDVSSNYVSDMSNNGIQIWGEKGGASTPTIVSNNVITRVAAKNGSDGPYGNGINAFKAHGVNISNNHITDCAFTAIRNNSSDNCIINGNNIARCNETALYVEFAFLGAVVSNNIVDTAAQGISITNFNDGGRMALCTGNIVRNIAGVNAHNEPMGGAISAEAETVVANNVIEKTEDFGLQLGWGPYARNLVANSNVLNDCTKGILFSAVAPGPIQISNNVISGATKGSIVGMDHYKAVTPDLGVDASQTPKHVTLADNVIKS